jgi:hypothetical protein
MSQNFKSIDIKTFGLLHGIPATDQFALNKMYKKTEKSYSDWHDIVSAQFKIGPKKEFAAASDSAVKS